MCVNNGDAALVTALYLSLISKGFDVKIATYYYAVAKKKYPHLPLVRELSDYYFLKKLPFLKPVLVRINFWLKSNYRNNDLFIACPGGYVNSYYQLNYALLSLKLAHKLGKKTAIYAQSVGPFNPNDSRLFSAASKYLDLVLVRDEFSMQIMKDLNYSGNYYQTKDAAFLLERSSSRNVENSKKVAISVREWSFDERNMSRYIDLMSQICLQLIKRGYSIEFLSTCQGVPGYKDDSKTAELIKKNLEENFNVYNNIEVNASYYNVEGLMDKLAEYDFVVGTRLHMCILSWVCNVPAFNISYEVKGKECYNYLGIPRYSIDFNEDIAVAEKMLDEFISDRDSFKEDVFARVQGIRHEVKTDFEKFVNSLNLLDN